MGGVVSHIRSIAEGFSRSEEIECLIATLPGRTKDASFLSAFDSLGKDAYQVPMTWRFDWRACARLRDFIRANNVDVVHTHGYRGCAVIAAARIDLPWIHTCHGMLVEPDMKLRLYEWMSLRLMRRAGRVVACSRFVADWLIRQGVSANKMRVVYNAYQARPTSGGVGRAELGIAEDALVALYVGRLVSGKGLEHAITAAAEIDNVFLLFVGDGPQHDALEQQAKREKANARFVGRQSDVASYYELSNVVLLPSKMEAMPMTLIEAAAHGRPVIASRVGGIPEIVEDGESGILAPYGDAAAIREALSRLENANLRERMGARARQLWQSKYTTDRMASELAAIVGEVVDDKRHAS